MVVAEESLLTAAQVARRLGVSTGAVVWWIKRGRLRAVQPGGPRGLYRIPESEVRRIATLPPLPGEDREGQP